MNVLTYHSLDGSGSVISVTPDAFESQMRLLARRGYTGIRFDTLIDAWFGRGDHRLPERPVVLTFDDAYVNFLDCAAPVLAELGFSATVFAVSGHCGKTNDWPGQDNSIPRLDVCSFTQLREIAAAGFEIGGHTATHPRLAGLDRRRAEQEIVDSRAVIEDHLGAGVRTFAYPFGAYDAAALELVRAHYDGACTTRLATAQPISAHEVSRIDMYYLRNPSLFGMFGTSLGRAYLGLRGLGRRLRGE